MLSSGLSRIRACENRGDPSDPAGLIDNFPAMNRNRSFFYPWYPCHPWSLPDEEWNGLESALTYQPVPNRSRQKVESMSVIDYKPRAQRTGPRRCKPRRIQKPINLVGDDVRRFIFQNPKDQSLLTSAPTRCRRRGDETQISFLAGWFGSGIEAGEAMLSVIFQNPKVQSLLTSAPTDFGSAVVPSWRKLFSTIFMVGRFLSYPMC